MDLKSKRKIRLIKFSVIFVIFSFLIYFFGSKIKPEDIAPLVERAGIFGPLIYIFLMSVTYIVPPLSGTPVFLAGYLLFGKKMIIYVYTASLLSSVVNFWIAKIWGRNIVIKMVGPKNMEKVDKFTENYGLKALIFLRIFQGYLFDFVSYAYGLTRMKFMPYFIVCLLAPIPWWAAWEFFLFDRIKDFGDFTIWFVISMIPFYLVSVFFVAKLRKNKNVQQEK